MIECTWFDAVSFLLIFRDIGRDPHILPSDLIDNALHSKMLILQTDTELIHALNDEWSLTTIAWLFRLIQ